MNIFSNQFNKSNVTVSFEVLHKCYSRWASRKPHRTLTVDEYENQNNPQKISWQPIRLPKKDSVEVDIINIDAINESDNKKVHKRGKIHERGRLMSKSKGTNASTNVTTDMLQVVFNENGEFIYTKMRDRDARIGSLLTSVKSRKEKTKKDMILLEGKRLILDALDSSCILKYVLFSRISDLEYLKPKLPKSGAFLYKMPYNEMQMWSDLTTTPGIMGIFRIPDTEHYKAPTPQLPITFVLDNVREPGNMGAILRVCAGVSCARVLLTKGCVGLWEPKVVRGAMGAHFRLRIHRNVDHSEIGRIVTGDMQSDTQLKVLIADTKNENNNDFVLPVVPYYSHQFNKNEEFVIIIGGETEGISEESYNFAKEQNGACLNIPLSNGTESLNSGAALAVIGFEIKKQLTLLYNT